MTPRSQQRVDALYRRRIQSLQAVDLGIAHLIATLRATGQLDNTYIVFTSDNGFHLGQFRMPAGKQTAYDFDIHLPLIVRGPGVPQGGPPTSSSATSTWRPRSRRWAARSRRASSTADRSCRIGQGSDQSDRAGATRT